MNTETTQKLIKTLNAISARELGTALERLKNQIAWLEYVPEEELTESEANRLSAACERLIIVISKLNKKYID